MRKLADRTSPTGRIVIVVAAAIIALAILIFFLWSPIKPVLDNDSPFGVPQESTPRAPAPSGG